MSKSRKNVVDPEDIINAYGADTARWFMLSDSPPDRDLDWTAAGISGSWRFTNRLWRLVASRASSLPPIGQGPEAGVQSDLRQSVHQAIAGVTDDLEGFHFNRAVARIYGLVNIISDAKPGVCGAALREGLESIALLIGPMMPHLAEELWALLGHDTLVAENSWPIADRAFLTRDTVEIAVQVCGKLRGTIEIARDANQSIAEAAALSLSTVTAALAGKDAKKIIYVPNRIINVIN